MTTTTTHNKKKPADTNARVVDKSTLKMLNTWSHRQRYNRLLNPEAVESLPENLNFIVAPIMIHEHRMGESCEPHMRCFLYVPNKLEGTIDEIANSGFQPVVVDFDMALFFALPTVQSVCGSNENESVGESNDSTNAEV